jgi:hypothetical protein
MDSGGIEERLLESGNNDHDYESNGKEVGLSVETHRSNDGREENGSITKRLIKKCKRHHSLDVESMEISGSHPHHHHFKVNYSQMLFVLCFVVEFFVFLTNSFFFSFE